MSGHDLIIRAGPLAGGGRLIRDYTAGRASEFYSGHSDDVASYRRKAAEVDARMDAAARQRVAGALEPLGDAAERMLRILSGDGYFVTTGQQPALFGGPLYTLYKVLAAIRAADALEQALGRPVLALFWVGADDHDWAEASHATVLDEHGYAKQLSVAAPDDVPPLPLSERVWGEGIGAVVDEFVRLLPPLPYAQEIARHVRAAYRADATVEQSFTETMRMLLADRRVAMVSSAHPLLRRASVPLLQHEVRNTVQHAEALTGRARALEAAGYNAQVAIDADAANLMLTDEYGRERLAHTRAGWHTRRTGAGLDENALLRRIDTEPERFSPNVLLRPVIENALFPTIAYVAGPGELSYFAQLQPLFESHGIMPPVVVPRPSVLLIEPHIQRALAGLGIEDEALRRPLEEVASELMRRRMPQDIRAALDSLEATLLEEYDTLGDAASGIDVTLRGTVTAARNAALLRLRETEKKIVARMKRSDTETMDRLRRAAASLRPGGAPQERMLGPLPVVARYGSGLPAAVEAELRGAFGLVRAAAATPAA